MNRYKQLAKRERSHLQRAWLTNFNAITRIGRNSEPSFIPLSSVVHYTSRLCPSKVFDRSFASCPPKVDFGVYGSIAIDLGFICLSNLFLSLNRNLYV